MIRAVESLRDDVARLTQELIRIPSLTGQEKELAEFVLGELKRRGPDDAFIDGIGNVIGVLRGKGKGPNILLNTHLDIVPAGELEKWGGYDPFGGEIDPEGNIHGRGAADDKAGLAVHLYTMALMKELRDRGVTLPGDLIFSSVVHEEAAEMFGIEYLCKKTLPEKGMNFDVVFLGEPTDLNLMLGHRGKVELVVTTHGKTAHSSTPWAGINALEKMLPILNQVFNGMNKSLQKHPELGRCSITVTNLVCRPGTLSMIPDECEIAIDRRYMPGETLDSILAEFERVFRAMRTGDVQFDADVRPRVFSEESYTGYQKEVQKHHPVWILDKQHPFVLKTISALQRLGQNPELGYWPGGTDGSMTAALMGIPTIGYSGMQFQYAHTAEEMVNIEMIMQSLEGYFFIVCEFFGVDVLSVVS